MELQEKIKAISAQRNYCTNYHLPMFMPSDGRCFRCGRNIFEKKFVNSIETGYSVEYATTHLITGCPHCYASFCD